jgi:hypothetical protein
VERCIWCLQTNAVVLLLQITEMTALFLEQPGQEARLDASKSVGSQLAILAFRLSQTGSLAY